MQLEKINEDVSIGCEVYNNSRAWGHEAKLFYRGQEVAKNRVRYHNRTWEAYQFDSVKKGLLSKVDKEKTIPLSDRVALAKFINRS
jgi:hypothetical protein